jgi:hypothetical protein
VAETERDGGGAFKVSPGIGLQLFWRTCSK